MEVDEVKERIEKAIIAFYGKEIFLIQNDLNERTLTHKLAIYIENIFQDTGYDVDCEYNRMEGESGNYVAKALPCRNDIGSDDTGANTVYPDIIVHKRGLNDNNLLIIEVKKKFNITNGNQNIDELKIQSYCSDLSYSFGLFLLISDFPQYKWFVNGNWENEELRSFASSR